MHDKIVSQNLKYLPVDGAGCPMVMETNENIRWSAKWISPAGEKNQNYYFLARKKFHITEKPARAILRITADARYAAYVNGIFVGNGPVRGTHKRYFADSYDVATLLRPGTNWIAVEAHCCLKPTYTMVPFQPALLAEIEGLAATDLSWQVCIDPSHRTDSFMYTGQIGFSEWKALPSECNGWMTGQDTPKTWEPPLEIGTPDNLGGRQTVPRPIAPLSNEQLPPSSIVEIGCVPTSPEVANDPDYATLLSTEKHMPQSIPPEHVVQPKVLSKPLKLIPASNHEGNYVVLDFGCEVFGNLSIDIEAPANTILDVSHSDGIFDGRVHALVGKYRFADRFVLRAGRQTVNQRLHTRGFRFLQLTLRDSASPVHIHGVTLVSRSYFRHPLGTFSCQDPFLNRLWAMSVNTLRACSSDTFMDCPWREQALWTNDQAVTSLFYIALTGDPAFAAHNLRMGADGARPDGLIPPVYPSQTQRHFPVLPALWTFTLSDYYQYTGDMETLKQLLTVMERGLGIYEIWRDSDDGLIADQDGMWNFVDWGYRGGQPFPAPGGKTAVLNMLIAAAYKRAAMLEKVIGHLDRAAEYTERSRQTVAAVNAALWDPSRGRFHDCTAYAEGVEPSSSQHPMAIGLYHDLFDETQRSAVISNLQSPDLIQAEFYFQHYVLQGLAKNGEVAAALNVIRNMWRDNVQSDCNTVWEFHTGHQHVPEAMSSHSRCHAFSCAPLYFMQSVILGVQPISPGFSEFTLAPQPGDLMEAQGTVPTPHGLIHVAWIRTATGKIHVVVDIPVGTRAVTKSDGIYEPGRHELELPL
jgi:hypothetical protein